MGWLCAFCTGKAIQIGPIEWRLAVSLVCVCVCDCVGLGTGAWARKTYDEIQLARDANYIMKAVNKKETRAI